MSSATVWGGLRVADRERREEVRRSGRVGLASIEVESNGREPELRVRFLGRTHPNLAAANIVIESPPGAPPLHVVSVERRRGTDDAAEHLAVRLHRRGNAGVHTLHLVATRADGTSARRPPRSVDARYAALSFSFDVQTPVPRPPRATPAPRPAVEETPNTYLDRDFDGLSRLLLDRLAVTRPGAREEHTADLTVALLELFAYAGDDLAYGQDAAATEAYLRTARRRVSMRRHGRLLGYRLHEGSCARTWMHVAVDQDLTLPIRALRFATADHASGPSERAGIGFAPLEAGVATDRSARSVRLLEKHNEMTAWTFGEAEARLLAGATGLALKDGDAMPDDGPPGSPRPRPVRVLDLHIGDVLVLEATHSATGSGPADPAARHPVRLTRVTRGFDELYGQAFVEVRWSHEDALPFDLQVSTLDDDVAVSCLHVLGNNLLAGQGRPVQAVVDLREPRLPPGLAWAQPFPRPFVVARHQARELRLLDERLRHQIVAWQRSADAGWPLTPPVLARLRSLFADGVDDLPDGTTRNDAWYQADVLAELLEHLDRYLCDRVARAEELARRCEADGLLDASLLAELERDWGAELVDVLSPDSPASAGPASSVYADDPRRALPMLRLVPALDPGNYRDDLPWLPRTDLLWSAPDAREVAIETETGSDTRLHFPPQAPLPESRRFRADVWLGDGSAGNVPADAVTTVRLEHGESTPVLLQVRNPLPARGGAQPEDLTGAQRAMPDSFRLDQPRALVAADYARAAEQVEGVRRAAAERRESRSGRLIDVCIVPTGTGEPPPWFLAEVGHRLERVRRLGDTVRVRAPRHRGLIIRLDVVAEESVDPVTLEARIRRRLGNGSDTCGVPAMFHPSAVEFGQVVWRNTVLAIVQRLDGVRDVELPDWGSWPHRLTPHAEPTDRIRCGGLELPRLDDDPAHPENGLLDVRVRVVQL